MKSRTLSLTLAFVSLLCTAVSAGRTQETGSVGFVDATGESGLHFVHENGRTPEKYLPETMGGGVLIFDYDRDGWPDVFFVNSGSIKDPQAAGGSGHRLYRNKGDGTFADATSMSGIGLSGYGMGACSADFDNDGWPDLYVTSLSGNTLYRNTGEGRFADVTRHAGVAGSAWSSSCAFADIDNDGDVDLYVVNYLDFSVENNRYCGDPVARVRIYCDPNAYGGVSDSLYRNEGNGTFTDVSRESGIYTNEGKGLGVVFTDYDLDGWIDIYVANDLVPNFLFHNLGNGIFEEVGLLAGVAVAGDGRAMSGMGTDMADIDGDGLPDGIVTNMDRETHNLYRNMGGGLFLDVTFASGVGTATLPYVGWGTAFLDYDNDSDLDLAIANGAVLDNVAYFRDSTYEQRNLLLSNDGKGKFTALGSAAGPGFAIRKVSRGMAVGDLDNDGDLDVLIGNNGQAADLLRNEMGNRNNSLLVRTIGTTANRDGIGARLRLHVNGSVLTREVKAGSGYLSQNDSRVHFGMGSAARANRLEITWPGGRRDVLENIDANQILVIQEGGVIVGRESFR